MTNMQPRWATRKEAADYARVSTDTIDRWCTDTRVPITRHNAGSAIRIDLNEIDTWFRANTSGKRTA